MCEREKESVYMCLYVVCLPESVARSCVCLFLVVYVHMCINACARAHVGLVFFYHGNGTETRRLQCCEGLIDAAHKACIVAPDVGPIVPSSSKGASADN